VYLLAGLWFAAIAASALASGCGSAHAVGAAVAVSAPSATKPVANRVLNRFGWRTGCCLGMLCSFGSARVHRQVASVSEFGAGGVPSAGSVRL
jgi:hypothetical protein